MSELTNRQLALRWFEYAKNDLQAASIIPSHGGVAPRTACFLAQQSAEKALKVSYKTVCRKCYIARLVYGA